MVRVSSLKDGGISKRREVLAVALTKTDGTFLSLCSLKIRKGDCRHYPVSFNCGDAGDLLMDSWTGFYT